MNAARAPSFEFVQMAEDDTYVHLQRLQQVAPHVLPHQFLRLCPRERDIPLLEEGRDVPLRDLRLRVHPVLQLPEPLRGEAQLGLFPVRIGLHVARLYGRNAP